MQDQDQKAVTGQRAVFSLPPLERRPDEFEQIPVNDATCALPETVEATREYVRRMFGREQLASVELERAA